ncbi:MAG: hypothetical protein JXL80_18095 [Planctomycetes bacterium]|nr:hypothetical protein [Planctomycetota bacterium]
MDHVANTRNQPCHVDPDDLGSARITPTGPFPVATLGTWTLTYTAGRLGLDDSGAIILVRRIDDGSPPQVADSTAPGYVTVTTDADVRLEVRCDGGFWVRPWRGAVIATVRDGSLRQGDTITLTLGDTRSGSPGWRLQSFPEPQHRFGVLADAFGTGEFYWLAEQPAIEIVPGPPAGIEVVLPSLAEAGRPVQGHVRVCDAFGNPVRGPAGHATIACDGFDPSSCGLPVEIDQGDGVVPFGPITFGEPGDYRLCVRCGNLAGESNPVRVAAAGRRPFSLYWADMHGQTAETVGTGTVEEFYRFARDRALIDVASWQGNDFQVTDDLWREVRRQTPPPTSPAAL